MTITRFEEKIARFSSPEIVETRVVSGFFAVLTFNEIRFEYS